MLNASYIYSGCPDYFGGHGCNDNEWLLYAYYGPNTTLADIVDQLVDDGWGNEGIPEEVTDSDVRKALLETMLTDPGRADYASGFIAECAAAYEIDSECSECGGELSREDWPDCPECGRCVDTYDSPIFVTLLSYEK
jgi:hypothetical protein